MKAAMFSQTRQKLISKKQIRQMPKKSKLRKKYGFPVAGVGLIPGIRLISEI